MATVDVTGRRGPLNSKTVLVLLVLAVSIVASGWALVTVSRTFRIPPSDFVTLPTTPISKTGTVTVFTSVTPIVQNGMTVGVTGYLQTASGQPVSGAQVYVH